MILDNRKNPCVCRASSYWLGCCLTIMGIATLAGCGSSANDLEDIYAGLEAATTWSQPPAVQLVENTLATPISADHSQENPPRNEFEPRLAGMISLPEVSAEELEFSDERLESPTEEIEETFAQKYWSFPSENPNEEDDPLLVRLPPTDGQTELPAVGPAELSAQLMPPQSISPEVLFRLPRVEDDEPLADVELQRPQEEPVARPVL